jgi:hypothetical protein
VVGWWEQVVAEPLDVVGGVAAEGGEVVAVDGVAFGGRLVHATELVDDGVSLATIRKRLGHRTFRPPPGTLFSPMPPLTLCCVPDVATATSA